VCPACGKPEYRKQLSAAGFQLKGTGWYATDFKGAGKKAADKEKKSDAKTDSKTDAKPESKTESKPETKSESKAAA
jgi:predicted nucleic acid-binding Zn ribbon protein